MNQEKDDSALQHAVINAIKFQSLINAAVIGVTVNDGIVTLTGTVNSYARKWKVEATAKNLAGVKAVVEAIEVKPENAGEERDTDIAIKVLNVLKADFFVPTDVIKVTVEQGHVTLSGEVNWDYQKQAAKKATEKVPGIKVLTDHIVVEQEAKFDIEIKHITQALMLNWPANDRDIHIDITGHKVTLRGSVKTHSQKQEAELIAWSDHNVWNVENELVIELKN